MKNLINHLLLLWLCAIVSHTAQAQGTVVWEKPIAKIARSQELKTAVESRDKQFWVGIGTTSMTSPNGSSSRATSVVAFDAATGDSLWYKPFFQYPVRSQAWGIAPAPSGHFWVVMQFYTNYGFYTSDSAGIAVFEIDSLGNILQQKEFMLGCQTFNPFSVYPQPDGGILITGLIAYGTATCNDWDLFALRLNGQGNQLWQVTYTLPYDQGILSAGLYPGNKLCIGYYDANTSFQNRMLFIDAASGVLLYKKNTPSGAGRFNLSCHPLRDGSFMVMGCASPNTSINNAYIAKTDANFNILWQRIDYNANIYAHVMKETQDTAAIVYSKNVNVGLFMAKVDLQTGQELWRTYFASASGATPLIPNIEIGSNNDVYAVGYIEIPNVTQAYDFYAARYTNVADFLQPSDYCSDSLRANFAGTWLNDTLRLRSTSNSGMAHQDSVDCQWFIGGNTVSLDTAMQQIVSMQANPEGVNVTLVITNFWGCKDTLIARVLPNGTITGNRPVVKTGHTPSLQNAYPNPSAQNVSIGYTLPAKTENAVLRVYEMSTGRTVAERNLSSNTQETRFDVSGWATGVYAYQLYINGAPVAVKKMVVSR